MPVGRYSMLYKHVSFYYALTKLVTITPTFVWGHLSLQGIEFQWNQIASHVTGAMKKTWIVKRVPLSIFYLYYEDIYFSWSYHWKNLKVDGLSIQKVFQEGIKIQSTYVPSLAINYRTFSMVLIHWWKMQILVIVSCFHMEVGRNFSIN